MRLTGKSFLVLASAGSMFVACRAIQPEAETLMADSTAGFQPMGRALPQPFSYFCGDASSGECQGAGRLLVSSQPQSENGRSFAAGQVFMAHYKHQGGGMKGRSELGVALPFDGKDTSFTYELVAKTSINVGTFMQVQPMCGRWTPYLMVTGKGRQLSLSIFPSSKDEQHKVICTADMGDDGFLTRIHSYKFVGLLSNSDRGYWDLYVDGKLVTTSCQAEGHSYSGDTIANDVCDASQDKSVKPGQEIQLKIGTYEGWHNPNPSEAWATFYTQQKPSVSPNRTGGGATGGAFAPQSASDSLEAAGNLAPSTLDSDGSS